MRIGIDATCWANGRGYGRYTRELVSAMAPQVPAHELVCFLDERAGERFELVADNVTRVTVPQTVSPTEAASSGGRRSPRDMLRLTGAVRRAGLDVFFSPSVYGFFPLPPGLPAAVVVHDAIAERFPELTLPTMRDRVFWWMKVRLALQQARVIVTVSDYAKAEIARYLGVPAARIRVTLEGVSAAYAPSESQDAIRDAARHVGLPDSARWLIYVGGFGPHKHVDVLIRAHAELARRHSDPPALLLVGPQDDGFHQDVAGLRQLIRDCGTEALVRWPGYLPDEQLRHLHSGALALVLASASEGFGLPAVEAARCGCPVVATMASPLPSILEGGGLFVDPGDVAQLVAALQRMTTDEPARRAMARRAFERASTLSWSKSARAALDAIEEAAAVRLPAAV